MIAKYREECHGVGHFAPPLVLSPVGGLGQISHSELAQSVGAEPVLQSERGPSLQLRQEGELEPAFNEQNSQHVLLLHRVLAHQAGRRTQRPPKRIRHRGRRQASAGPHALCSEPSGDRRGRTCVHLWAVGVHGVMRFRAI